MQLNVHCSHVTRRIVGTQQNLIWFEQGHYSLQILRLFHAVASQAQTGFESVRITMMRWNLGAPGNVTAIKFFPVCEYDSTINDKPLTAMRWPIL